MHGRARRVRAQPQSLRVVELLENAYPKFPGLNLTFEVREGLRKHQAFYDLPAPNEEEYRCPSLEAQIANLADEITYYSHDLDDAVDFEILDSSQLEESMVWRRSHATVLGRYPRCARDRAAQINYPRHYDVQVQDVVRSSANAIKQSGVQSATK